MPLPSSGKLAITGNGQAKRVIELNLTEEVLRNLQRAQKTDQKLSIRLGKNQESVTICAGTEFYDCVSETKPAQANKLYRQVSPTKLEFIGNITNEATLKKVYDERKLQRAKSKLKARNEAVEQEKNSRKIVLLNDYQQKQKTSPTNRIGRVRLSTPSKPLPTTERRTVNIPPPIKKSTNEKPDGIPLLQRIIQLLAITDSSVKSIAEKTNTSVDEVMSHLKPIALWTGNAWRLKNETYKRVKVHDWHQYHGRQKDMVLKRATEAFDALGLPKDAPERRRLFEFKLKREAPSSASSVMTPSTTAAESPGEPQRKRLKTTTAKTATTTKIKAPAPAPLSTSTQSAVSLTKSPAPRKTAVKADLLNKSQKAATPTPTPTPPQTSNSIQSSLGEVSDLAPSPIGSSNTNTSNGGGKYDSPSSTSTSTSFNSIINEKHQIPRVTNLRLFKEQSKKFQTKHVTYSKMFEEIKIHHSTYLELIKLAQTEDPEKKAEINQKIAANFGEGGSVTRLMEQYAELHEELAAIKKELWRASEEEVFYTGDDETEDMETEKCDENKEN